MNKAVPWTWTNHDVELDVREAARHAARREGLSVSDWLDKIVVRRAAARGVAASDLSADERLDAVTEQLVRLARERPAHSQSAERILANFESDRRRTRGYSGADQPAAAAPRSVRDKGIIDLIKPAPADDTQALQPEDEPADTTEVAAARSTPQRSGAAELQSSISESVRTWGEQPAPPTAEMPVETRDAVPQPSPDRIVPEATVEPDRDVPDQMSQVEAKLAALFQALDKTPERSTKRAAAVASLNESTLPAPPEILLSEAPAPEATAEPEATPMPPVLLPRAETPVGPTVRAQSLGGTALGSAPSLEVAIAQIAERQAFLDRAGQARDVPPKRSSLAGDLLQRYSIARLRRATIEPSRGEMPAPAPDGTPTEQVRPSIEAAVSVPTAESEPSIFAALQTEISGLARRLEDVHRDAARRDATIAKEASLTDLRGLIDRFGQGGAIGVLEQRVETLATKIDQAIETRLRPEAIEHLSSRIEDVRTAMTASQARAADTGALEQKIDGLSGDLDAMVRGLAAKLDDARRPQADAAVFGELQAQLGSLAERIDRSDAGLAAIVSVERSLGELFTQLEETREAAINAAETAARTAARDTLRAAMLDASLPVAQGQSAADAVMANVTQQIAELKATRETADLRLQSMLTALNKTLEKVADRLSLDAGLKTGSRKLADHPADDDVLDLAEVASVQSRPDDTGGSDRPLGAIDLDEADFPIEPGSAAVLPSVPLRKPVVRSGSDDIKTDPAHFIMAARRAAQESMNRTSANTVRRTEAAAEAEAGSIGAQATSFVARRRRPLLLTLAGVVVLLGAAQLARIAMSQPDAVAVSDASGTTEAAPTAADPMPASAPAANMANATPSAPDPAPTSAKTGDGGTQLDPPAETTVPTVASAAPPPATPGTGNTVETAPASSASVGPLDPVKSLPTLAMGFGAKRPTSGDVQGGIPAGLRDLAKAGNPAAEYEVGLRMADGRGVTRDLKGAADWFEKAAKQGLAPAAYRLGSLYEKGLGVPRDAALSTEWYQKAADQGNVRAMHNLAVMSAEGAGGKSDYARAATWFTKAAQAGVRDSQFNLAILYARGLGIEQSLAQSYTWFAVAAAQGDTDAAKKRDEVATRLDAKSLAQAKAAADQFQPTPTNAAANEVKAPAGGWDAVAPGSAAFGPSSAPPASKPAPQAHVSSL